MEFSGGKLKQQGFFHSVTEKFASVLKKSFNYMDNIKLCLEAKTNKHNLNMCLELLLCFSHSLHLLFF